RELLNIMPFFSIQEAEGLAVRSWLRGFMPGYHGQALKFWGGILLGTLATAELINLASTGKPLSTAQLKPWRTQSDPLTGRPETGFNPIFWRPQLPFDGPDGRHTFLDLLGQADTPIRVPLDLGSLANNPGIPFSVKTRFQPWISIVLGLSSGKDPFTGELIAPSQKPEEAYLQRLFFIGRELAPIPTSGFFEERERIGLTPSLMQAGGTNVSSESLRDLRNRTMLDESGGEYDYDHAPRDKQRAFDQKYTDLTDARIEGTARSAAGGDPIAQFREETTRLTDEAEKGYTDEDGQQVRGLAEIAAMKERGELDFKGYAQARSDLLANRSEQIGRTQRRLGLSDEQLKGSTDDPFYLNDLANRIGSVPYPGVGATDQEVEAWRSQREALLAPLTPEERHRVLVDFQVARWRDPVLQETERRYLEARFVVDESPYDDAIGQVLERFGAASGFPSSMADFRTEIRSQLQAAGRDSSDAQVEKYQRQIMDTWLRESGMTYRTAKGNIVPMTVAHLKERAREADPQMDTALALTGRTSCLRTKAAVQFWDSAWGPVPNNGLLCGEREE
ncbi:MAG TPA: hypothetical protein VJA25_08135, partial [Dehalococcoidia bacterium]|nr:hypothetical protein [Dehalococcoidia bacterium]